MRDEVPYHYQPAGGPTIYVKNGFLHHRDESRDAEPRRVQRMKSAPATLSRLESTEAASDVETEIGGESGSFDKEEASVSSWTAPSSPELTFTQFQHSLESTPAPCRLDGSLRSAHADADSTRVHDELSCMAPGQDESDSWASQARLCGIIACPLVAFSLTGLDGDAENNTVFEEDASWMLPPAMALEGGHLPPQSTHFAQQSMHLLGQSSQLLHQRAPDVPAPEVGLLPQQAWPNFSRQTSLVSSFSSVSQSLAPHASSLPASPHVTPQASPQVLLQLSPLLQPQTSPQLWPPAEPLEPSPVPSSQTFCQVSPQLSPQQSPQLGPSQIVGDHSSGLGATRAAPTQQSALTHTVGMDGTHHVRWAVDAGRLVSRERQAVSSAFELPFGSVPGCLRLVLLPGPSLDGKGGTSSFRRAGGWGSVQLKSEASRGVATFSLSIGDGRTDHVRQPRGPVTHDFGVHSLCGLPRDQEKWEFTTAVDRESQTFTICLDITCS